MATNNTPIGKGQGNKLGFVSSLVEFALNNNFTDTVNYLGSNLRSLIPNLSLFICLNTESKEECVFAYTKLKKSYLPSALESTREFASKFSVDLNLSQFTTNILPEEQLIGAEGPDKPDCVITVPIPANAKPSVFLTFSEHGHIPLDKGDILFTANLLSSLWEFELREKIKREGIERLVFIDSLTGVFNRHAFYQMFSQDVSEGQRNGTPFSLLVFDIDGFKQINDSRGHSFGDMVLKRVTSKFKNLLRKEDKMFRLGGDEFAVIVKANKTDALTIIRRILKEVSNSISPGLR
jgi:GGDEF domain-containing protein